MTSADTRPRVHRSKRIFAPAVAIVALGLLVGAAHSVVQPITLRMKDAEPTIIRIPTANTPTPDQSGQPTADASGAIAASTDDPGIQPDPAEVILGKFITLEQTHMLWRLTDRPVAFVDARHLEEYVAGHIPMAHLYAPEMRSGGIIPAWTSYYDPASTIVVVYCGGGTCTDSENAARDLQMLGFTSVHIFQDGFPAWQTAGHDIATGQPGGQPGGGS